MERGLAHARLLGELRGAVGRGAIGLDRAHDLADPVIAALPVYRREPGLALDGGGDGLALLRKFLTAAPDFLSPGGLLLAEIEASQGPTVTSLARGSFPGSQVTILPDLAGHDRLS